MNRNIPTGASLIESADLELELADSSADSSRPMHRKSASGYGPLLV